MTQPIKPRLTATILWTISKYLLALGVLSFVIVANWEPSEGRGGLRNVWQQPVHGGYLLLALAFHITSMFSVLYRWYILVRAQELPFTLFGALRLGTLGFVCNAFLPGAVGGDFVRATGLARTQSKRTIAVATVVMDRLLSLWGLILIVAAVGGACWFFDFFEPAILGRAEVIILTANVIIGASLVGWFVLGLCSPARSEQLADRLNQTPGIGVSLSQLWQAACLYRRRPANVAWAIVLTTLSNTGDILAFYCYAMTIGNATNAVPGLSEHFLIVPLGLVISGVPLFPGGAGIGEAGFGGLYELFGASVAAGVLGSLLFRVSGWVFGIAGYLLCLLLDGQPAGQLPNESNANPGI